MTWNRNLYPPDGYLFTDAEGIQHRGANLDGLISALAAYRIRRGIAVGNPAAEVNEYLCRNNPGKCLEYDPPSEESMEKTKSNQITSSVSVWLRSVWVRISNRTQKFVSNDEVKRRADICRACSVFHKSVAGDCSSCQESLNQLSFQLRAGHDQHSATLKSCTYFGTDLRLDATLDQPAVPDAPENCWKKATP